MTLLLTCDQKFEFLGKKSINTAWRISARLHIVQNSHRPKLHVLKSIYTDSALRPKFTEAKLHKLRIPSHITHIAPVDFTISRICPSAKTCKRVKSLIVGLKLGEKLAKRALSWSWGKELLGCQIRAKTGCKNIMNLRIDFKSTQNNNYIKIAAFIPLKYTKNNMIFIKNTWKIIK